VRLPRVFASPPSLFPKQPGPPNCVVVPYRFFPLEKVLPMSLTAQKDHGQQSHWSVLGMQQFARERFVLMAGPTQPRPANQHLRAIPALPRTGSDRQGSRSDGRAFEILYAMHKRRVYSLCLRMLGNVAEAEDLTQEAFLQLYRKISTFRGDSAFSTCCTGWRSTSCSCTCAAKSTPSFAGRNARALTGRRSAKTLAPAISPFPGPSTASPWSGPSEFAPWIPPGFCAARCGRLRA